jgi:hypothetical protein
MSPAWMDVRQPNTANSYQKENIGCSFHRHRDNHASVPTLSPEEKRKQGERMASLICELIKEMGGLPSTAHGVAAALCKALEDRKYK